MKKILILAVLTVLLAVSVVSADPFGPAGTMSLTPAFTGASNTTGAGTVTGNLDTMGDLIGYLDFSVVADQTPWIQSGYQTFKGAEIYVVAGQRTLDGMFFFYLDNTGVWQYSGEAVNGTAPQNITPHITLFGDMTGTTITHMPIKLVSNDLLFGIPDGNYDLFIMVDPINDDGGFPADGHITIPSSATHPFCSMGPGTCSNSPLDGMSILKNSSQNLFTATPW